MNVDGASSTISPRFAKASSAVSQSSTVSHERVAEVSTKRDRVTERAEAHFEKHRQKWTNRQYGELLARDGERMALRPFGMPDDRKAHLMRAADSLVLHRQAKRLAKIDRAAGNLLGENRNGRNEAVSR